LTDHRVHLDLRNQPNLIVEWQGDDRFSTNSPEADAAWNELMPSMYTLILAAAAEKC